MRHATIDGPFRNLLRAAVLILFVGYFGLVILKTPFDFSDPEYEAPRSGRTQAQMVIANEPYDHFRTGAASLLLGLLVGNALLELASTERRRFAVAILVSSSVLITSTFFGLSPFATQPILLLVALYGCCVAVNSLRASAAPIL
jgi:hypothetical protein